MANTAGPTITDPAQTMERCYVRLNFLEGVLADYESKGWDVFAQRTRRQIASTKGMITRMAKRMAV